MRCAVAYDINRGLGMCSVNGPNLDPTYAVIGPKVVVPMKTCWLTWSVPLKGKHRHLKSVVGKMFGIAIAQSLSPLLKRM